MTHPAPANKSARFLVDIDLLAAARGTTLRRAAAANIMLLDADSFEEVCREMEIVCTYVRKFCLGSSVNLSHVVVRSETPLLNRICTAHFSDSRDRIDGCNI